MNRNVNRNVNRNAFLKGIAALMLAVAPLATVAGTAHAAEWDMPTPYPDKTFHTVNIQQFADEVREATGGELDITIHSAGSLIKHPEIKNAVRSGQVPAGEFFMSLISNENPVYGLDSQPFLAASYEDAEKLWNAQKPVVTETLAAQNLVPLFSVPWPPQGLYTKQEIASVDDMKGLKLRAYNAALEEFANLAGAAPTQVEVPDIPQAFSTGQVEAMITSPSTGANSAAWDYVGVYTPIDAWLPKNVVVVNKDAFDALDDATREAVMTAAAAAETRGWEMSRAETDEMTRMLADNGMTIAEPSAELMEGLRAIGEQMKQSMTESATPEAMTVLEGFGG